MRPPPLAIAGRRLLGLVGVAWASPYTLAGMVVGVAAMAMGARATWRRDEWMLAFDRVPFGPGGALTLGNVVLNTGASLDVACETYAHRAGWCVEAPVGLRAHEAAHVLQYMALGPLFLPLYFACGGISARNRFERAADRYAREGRGWWPWAGGLPQP